jgi:hypothetical protein
MYNTEATLKYFIAQALASAALLCIVVMKTLTENLFSFDLCHLQHKLIGFYNRDEKCLQRGTDWGFK